LIGLVTLPGCGSSKEQQAVDAHDRGREHFLKGEFDKAIEEYDEAIRLDPECSDAHLDRGTCYNLSKRETEQAAADYTEAIRLDPECSLAYFLRAFTHGDEEHEKTIADLDEAIKLSPSFASAYEARGSRHLYNRDDPESAIADFTKLIEIAPEHATGYRVRAEAYRQIGEDEKADADTAKAEEKADEARAQAAADAPPPSEDVQRLRRRYRLREIALAMIEYEMKRKAFPPAASRDGEGKPLLSWRVAVLPDLEQRALYKEFHHDEPWDSPHNMSLVEQMPDVFAGPGGENDGKTTLMVFVGEGTPFGGERPPSADWISRGDGMANTIMIVDADPDKAVPWTKPEDLTLDPDDPAAALGDVPEEGFDAVLFDGTVIHIEKDVDAETLRRWIRHEDGPPTDR